MRGTGVASAYWNGRELQPVAATKAGTVPAISARLMSRAISSLKAGKKEVIVTPAGMNIYPEDLEAALRQQKEVRDCVVVGLERGGNAEPCAVLILSERSSHGTDPAAVQGIVDRANESLAEYQRMRTWFVWPDGDFPAAPLRNHAAM